MEPISLASLTLSSLLSALPANGAVVSKPTISKHTTPAIAGQWEIDLERSTIMMANASDHRASVASGVQEDEAETGADTEAADTLAPKCRERYNFAADNEMWTVSGHEWTYSRYLITHQDKGLPIIAIRTVYDNNEADCSQIQVDQTGEALIAFLNHKGNQMQWCADPDGQKCFMSFQRVLP